MQPLLDIAGLAVRYRDEDHDVLAVNGLSLTLGRGETYGLVGESGCGKSSVAMAIVRHLGRRGRIAQGSIRFDGVDLSTLREDEMRRLRGSRIAVIYQDPAAALNPTKRIGRQLAEVLVHHAGSSAAAARSPVIAMLRAMRVPDAELVLERYPHQLSGGQQQRVVIAMAFLARPELLILDEPTTALDVTVEREIIELLQEMQRANGTTALFISHNLGLVRRVCGRVGVMYGGQIVEEGSGDVLFGDPRHPYTRGLLACLPSHDSDKRSRRLHAIPGQVARLYAPPGGCTFMMRCAAARAEVCDVAVPELEPVDAAPGRLVRCFRQDVAAAIGRPATEHPATATSAPADAAPILEITALTKRFTLADGSAILANHEVSFDLVAGRPWRWSASPVPENRPLAGS